MQADASRRGQALRSLFGRLLVLMFALVAATPAPALETLPPALLLAERYRGDIDLSHYWVSEKLDGVRAVWNGKSLRFRSGNLVPAPQWFLDALPDQPLDGEQLRDIVRRGGEGLMLHRADAACEAGRSSVLLKVTPWLDAEAIVVALVIEAAVMGNLEISDTKVMSIAISQEMERNDQSGYDHRLHGVLLDAAPSAPGSQ